MIISRVINGKYKEGSLTCEKGVWTLRGFTFEEIKFSEAFQEYANS